MNKTDKILNLAIEENYIIHNIYNNNKQIFFIDYSRTPYKYKINALYFLSARTPKQLAQFFKTTVSALQVLINTSTYKEHYIIKKNGHKRELQTPERQLRRFQRYLNYYLQAYYFWIKPPFVHGFTIHPGFMPPSCPIAENAKAHCQKKYILNIDLKDFFPSISAKRVKHLFMSPLFKYDNQMATALTLLTTYKGNLPTGAPSSPVISNFICFELDKCLHTFSKDNNLTYTRYADDLSFSSDTFIEQDLLYKIISIIIDNDFMINPRKLHFKSAHKKQTVTGLTVNTKVNVPREMLKNVRAMLHSVRTEGVDKAAERHFSKYKLQTENQAPFLIFKYKLKGYINFIGQVRGRDDMLFKRLEDEYYSMFPY